MPFPGQSHDGTPHAQGANNSRAPWAQKQLSQHADGHRHRQDERVPEPIGAIRCVDTPHFAWPQPPRE